MWDCNIQTDIVVNEVAASIVETGVDVGVTENKIDVYSRDEKIEVSVSVQEILVEMELAWGDGWDVSAFETILPWKIGHNMYKEFVKTDWKYTQIDFWADATKAIKTFTKTISYIGGKPTTTVIVNEISWQTLTTTIVWDWNNPENVTKVLS